MAIEVAKQDVFEQARQEHEHIRERLKFLHQEFERRQASLEDINRWLRELRDCLGTHFHNEEREGFFDQIVTQAPHLSRQADSLSVEHGKLLEELDGIMRFADRGTGQPLCWRTLTLQFNDFMKKLMHHECEENGMLQQAFVSELGTKD